MLKFKDIKEIYKKVYYMEDLTEKEREIYETMRCWIGDEENLKWFENSLRVLDELKSVCGGVEYV